jgi:hypothetical protein
MPEGAGIKVKAREEENGKSFSLAVILIPFHLALCILVTKRDKDINFEALSSTISALKICSKISLRANFSTALPKSFSDKSHTHTK